MPADTERPMLHVMHHTLESCPLGARRDRRGAWPAAASITVAAGLAVGIGTQILQGVLPDGWGVIANSGVMWALMAFALGAILPTSRWAAVGGAGELVIASVVYYLAVDWFEGSSSEPRGAIIWSAAGIVAGSVFGGAGHWCRRHPGRRGPALALVSGVLFGEGVHLIWFVGNADLRAAGIAELAVAAAIFATCIVAAPWWPLRRSKPAVAAVTVGAAFATLAAVGLIDAVFHLSW